MKYLGTKHPALAGVLAWALIAAVVLAGCGPAAVPAAEPTVAGEPTQPTAAVEPTADAAPGPVNLIVGNHLANEEWNAAFSEYLAEYHDLNPHITIEQQSTTYEDLPARMATDRMADNPPDMYMAPAWWLGNLYETGFLAELPDDLAADVKNNYVPGVVDTVTWEGKIWGVPLETQTTVMIYNKPMLEEAGYTRPPETLTELKEYALNLTRNDDNGNVTQYGYSQFVGNLNTEYLPFASLLYSNGGQVLDLDKGEAAFNSPEGVEVLTMQTDLIAAGAFNPELTYTDWFTNRVAITILPGWTRVYLGTYGDLDSFASAPVPHGEGKESGSIVYSWFFFVNQDSPHKKEAFDFIRWFTQEPMGEGQVTRRSQFYDDLVGVIPSRTSDRDLWADRYDTDILPAFVEALEYAQTPPPIASYDEMVEIVNAAIENAWFGKATPQEALDAAAAEVNALLQMP